MEKRNISIYWLIDKMITKKHTDSELNGIFKQAKAMHKKEVQYAYWEGGMDKPKGSKECEQYYNERFGGQDE